MNDRNVSPDERVAPLLSRFGLAAQDPHPGVALGPAGWRGAGAVLGSFNPANERPLGRVRTAAREDLDAVIAASVDAARTWRDVPAPRRGEVVRRFGELLRAHKDALGTLVALENGKIKAEGDGEVQEMIDIADSPWGSRACCTGARCHRSGRRIACTSNGIRWAS
jgi:aldehyde dehydrogenase (NAD+)